MCLYGDDDKAESTVHKGFATFRSGNFNLEDRGDFGWPAVVIWQRSLQRYSI